MDETVLARQLAPGHPTLHWKLSPCVWWPQLTRIRHAVEDLRAADLLG